MPCMNCGGRSDRPGLFGCDFHFHVKPSVAQQIVAAIERDLRDRRGLRQEFEQIDEDTQYEIRDKWTELVESVLNSTAN